MIETGDPTTYRIYHNQDLIVRTVTPGRFTYRARVTVLTPGVGIREYEAEHASRKRAIEEATRKWVAAEILKEQGARKDSATQHIQTAAIRAVSADTKRRKE